MKQFYAAKAAAGQTLWQLQRSARLPSFHRSQLQEAQQTQQQLEEQQAAASKLRHSLAAAEQAAAATREELEAAQARAVEAEGLAAKVAQMEEDVKAYKEQLKEVSVTCTAAGWCSWEGTACTGLRMFELQLVGPQQQSLRQLICGSKACDPRRCCHPAACPASAALSRGYCHIAPLKPFPVCCFACRPGWLLTRR